MAPQAIPVAEETLPVQAQHLALLDTLNALLTQDSQPAVSVPQTAQSIVVSPATFSVSTWISQFMASAPGLSASVKLTVFNTLIYLPVMGRLRIYYANQIINQSFW